MIFSIKLINMKKYLLFSIVSIVLILFSNISYSQTVNLGILESFEGYSGAGAVTNAAGATWTGDVGTNIGIISGFGLPPSFTGNTYNANAVTAQCRSDLFRLYIHLNDLFVDYPATHAAAFGGGETLTPGVYSIPGAGSIGTILNLDGGGNPNAFFVIKFYGAMTVGAGAVVNLTNGTKSSNVFFIAQGAISVAADANIKGTLFSKIGAVGLGANTVLEGRMLSMQGAIVNGVGCKASPPPDACTIPIFCESDCTPSPAVDVLGVLANYALYTKLGAVPNTSTSGINGNIGSTVGDVSGFGDSVVIGSIIQSANTAQASTDLDNAYIKLMALPNTVLSHAAAFGSVAAGGETINAGVYFISGAGSLSGTLVLDGKNDRDAIFVFKFAGAFSVAAQAKMILINGARRCNVFFIGGAGVATGAISIGAGAVLKGTFLSHNGACGSGADLFLAGRQLSTGGAVNTYSGIIYNNPECITSTSLNPPRTAPVIMAITETTPAINGNTGGSTPALTTNDTLNGNPVVIGTAPGNVILTGVTVPQGLTLNPDGTVTIPPNTPAGEYPLTYKICEVSNPTNCDTVTSTIVVSTPGIALVKSSVISGTGNSLLGEVITYTFKLTNTGSTTLTNVVVTDPMVGLTITGSPIASLASGASSSVVTGTYIITQADVDAGGVTNSALATAQDPNGVSVTDTSGTANDNDTPTVTTLARTSAIALVKTATISGTGNGLLGEVITYTFKLTNTGNTTLTNVVVTDPMVGLTITGSPIASLASGASSSVVTGTYTITQSDVDAGGVNNSALATAQDPNGVSVTDTSGTANDNDTPTVTTLARTSAIALVKTATISGTGNGLLGEVITYTFKLTNTGNTTLTNVVVTDPMVGLTITGSPIASLASGASSSVVTGAYTITQADVDAGGVTNSALATAQDPTGVSVTDTSGTANDNDTPTVTTLVQTSSIALVKTAIVSGTGMLGDVITYIFTFKNTGNTTLTNVVVTDPMIINPFIGSPIASLAPGLTTIAMATYTITQFDIDAGGVTNSATATAKDPNGVDVTDISGIANDNDTPTGTPTAPPVIELVDFTPTIDIDDLGFVAAGDTRDFVVNISEIKGVPSGGQVIVKIVKPSAFLTTYGAATSTSNVNGGTLVNNTDWDINANGFFITMTLKTGVIIGANTSSAIGFTIARKPDVPTQTSQPITVSIVNGSGLDSRNYNNTYNTVVKAQ
jgi:hypothetical protein